jgi:hypothetical protein
MSPSEHNYDIHLDDKYGSLTVIDLPAEIAAHEPWFNQTLTTVNNAVVRLGIIEGEFHWHKHDDQDEFFLVIVGHLVIDRESRNRNPRTTPRLHHPKRRHAPHAGSPTNRDPHGRSRGRRSHRRLNQPERATFSSITSAATAAGHRQSQIGSRLPSTRKHEAGLGPRGVASLNRCKFAAALRFPR